MTTKRIKAAAGAGLSIMPTKKFKSNYFALNFYLPLDRQAASEISLLSRVMTRGTAAHPSIGELNKYTDMLYNLTFSLSAPTVGGVKSLSFRMDFIGDRFVPAAEKVNILDNALAFAVEFFSRPLLQDGGFLPEYVEAEKKLLIDKITGEINNKDSYALKRAYQHLLGDHPAAIPVNGDIETVSALTGEQLYKRLQSLLTGAHVEALYAGEIDIDTEEKVLSALRAILPADRTDAEMPRTEAFRPDGSDVRERVEKAKARQGRMVLGYHLPYSGEESAIANLFIEAFSASPVSRLFMNVRERLNLCYYCSASVDVSINTMMIRSGISEKNVEKAKAEIAHQLNDIASGGLSDEELETARITVLGSLKTLKDSQASLGEWYLRRIAIGAPSDIDALMQGVECVTAEQVAEFAGRIRHCTSYFLRGTEE